MSKPKSLIIHKTTIIESPDGLKKTTEYPPVTLVFKECPRCKVSQDRSCFSKNTNRKDGLQCYCKRCYIIMRQQSWDPKLERERKLLERYNLTMEEFDQRMIDQNGVCAICHESRDSVLDVDHNHTTGKVRGLLCRSCNRGLGIFRDCPERLENAAKYLRKEGFYE